MSERSSFSSSSSSPALSSASMVHEVFLSFRGSDTRKGFTGHLYAALDQKGVSTFMDEERLEAGGRIQDYLWTAIEGSSICIPIISQNYAESRWCLMEMAKMVQCHKTIIPIFYHVDPSDVRHQRGTFLSAFRNHERKFNKETVNEWREALKEVAGIKGFDLDNLTDGHEAKLVQLIVKRVLSEVKNAPVDVTKHPIGINSPVENMMQLLNIGDNKHVRMIGICGMGGIGKTTLAKAVFNQVFSSFESVSFIPNIREASNQPNGLVSLQKQLIFDMINYQTTEINEVSHGINMIKRRTRCKRVLIILDDVDHRDQLTALAGADTWFGAGSRVIITTRDEHLLNVHNVNFICRPNALSPFESLQLFSHHAFGRDKPMKEFVELSREVVSTTGGLPLAIEVLGCLLFDKRSTEEWQDVLKKIKRVPLLDVQRSLRISYDGLEQEEKQIFLDIACFFVGANIGNAVAVWNGCGFSSWLAIRCLLHKSLVKIGKSNKLEMHDLIRDMGRSIVYEEDPSEPGRRSRIWSQEEAKYILDNQKGTTKIEAIVAEGKFNNYIQAFALYFEQTLIRQTGKRDVNTEAFANISNLRILQINYLNLQGDFKHMPTKLGWLQWHGCPLKSLPDELDLRKIGVLDLSWSGIVHVWNRSYELENKIFDRLTFLNLSHCYQLEVTPDFSNLPMLEILILQFCSKLVSLHESIGYLRRLRFLDMSGCTTLTKLPDSFWNLNSLEDLRMSQCKLIDIGFKMLIDSGLLAKQKKENTEEHMFSGSSESTGGTTGAKEYGIGSSELSELLVDCICNNLKHLVALDLSYTEIEGLPDSILALDNISELTMSGCKQLKGLPESIGNMHDLEELTLADCQLLTTLPDSIGSMVNLAELDISETSIEELPESVGCLEKLKELRLWSCKMLRGLPNSIGSLTNLAELRLGRCESISSLPSSIGSMISLTSLELSETNIEELPETISSLKKLHTLKIRKCTKLKHLPLREMKGLVCLVVGGDNICDEFFQLPISKEYICGYAQSIREYRRLEFTNFEDWEHMSLAQWRLLVRVKNEERVILVEDVHYESDRGWHWGGYPSVHWLRLIFPQDFQYASCNEDSFYSGDATPDAVTDAYSNITTSALSVDVNPDSTMKGKEHAVHEPEYYYSNLTSNDASNYMNEEETLLRNNSKEEEITHPCFCLPLRWVRCLCGSRCVETLMHRVEDDR